MKKGTLRYRANCYLPAMSEWFRVILLCIDTDLSSLLFGKRMRRLGSGQKTWMYKTQENLEHRYKVTERSYSVGVKLGSDPTFLSDSSNPLEASVMEHRWLQSTLNTQQPGVVAVGLHILPMRGNRMLWRRHRCCKFARASLTFGIRHLISSRILMATPLNGPVLCIVSWYETPYWFIEKACTDLVDEKNSRLCNKLKGDRDSGSEFLSDLLCMLKNEDVTSINLAICACAGGRCFLLFCYRTYFLSCTDTILVFKPV